MDLGISGKVAFVAGGSQGMGRATAIMLAAEGCKVGVVARGQANIDTVVEEIRDAGGIAIGIAADLIGREGVNAAVAALTAEFGIPDIVVGQTNDATAGNFGDTTDEDYERVFQVFTMSQVYLARATVPAMQKKKWGRYVHIGSANGKEPQLSHPHILANAIRPSTVAFLRVLAHEVAADGVTINVVGPGLTDTPGLMKYVTGKMKITPEQAVDWAAGRPVSGIQGGQGAADIPVGRIGKPEEVAAMVCFFASAHAAYITASWIGVDGGRHHYTF